MSRFFMPRRLLTAVPALLLASSGVLSGAALAQQSDTDLIDAAGSGEAIGDKFGISLRLGLDVETEPDVAIDLEDFASRVTWSDQIDTGAGLDVVAFVDLGYGLDQAVFTREAWLGVEAGFGTIKGGTQFRAFYDTVTSFTDIGWWDTCYTAIACGRAPGVLKYERALSPTMQLVASATLADTVRQTGENEFIDQLEAGAIVDMGDGLEVGGAASLDLSGDDTGLALGVSARTTLEGDLDVAALVQFATDGYNDLAVAGENRVPRIVSDDNLLIASVSARKDNLYGLATIGDAEDIVIGLTAGYVMPLAGTSLIYAEVSGIDNGSADSDFNLSARAVFMYHFGAPEAARRR